ncbi:1,2-phenylacetyl-CoA epoxidase, catalytic subunit [Meinhardsimonia xiamenensis]|uniref:1,2-phenylacetyl-CoA epoxidase, catalytic subunit n=2 Tax=Meinhardsimonia xiamenensis TaxID=990712 RepID=A0A1G9GP28_9RHOB|nr:1,2-phenylacetyl-CoA epoxidase catalytic subunit [Meinhardsimonia xiamenensis]SDL02033.1 1,2-phenylacetyl-CoA epoxidase, catalytic subunit [Meinhardsimonia xiamenensis]
MRPMELNDYLAQGGRITSPEAAPARYRAELLRLMASFVDSELAGAAGFADTINDAPGLTERMAACRIVLEKTDHAARVLELMAGFGADTARYATRHPWEARVARDAELGPVRRGDMRLSVFHYPLDGWADAVVMNVLMGRATVIQLSEHARSSYQPLADLMRETIIPRERRHTELGEAGLARLLESDPATVAASAAYWRPRVAETFGAAESPRFEMLRAMGLRHRPNAVLRAEWEAGLAEIFPDLP